MFSFVGDTIPFGPIAPGVNLQAWGYNAYGQLGIGNLVTACSTTSEGGRYPDNSSVLVKHSESGATASAGSYHAAVIDNKGQVVTWGNNGFGELGTGSIASRSWATATIFP